MGRHADHVAVGDLTVRRWRPDDAAALHHLITENLEHLRPRMAWIANEPLTVQDRRDLIMGWDDRWADGGDIVCGIWRGDRPIGSSGLRDCGWADGPEIGYWVSATEQGRGVATATSRGLVDLAFTDPDIDAVYVTHCVTNTASRRIPEKLGFTDLGTITPGQHRPLAPADIGIDNAWRIARMDWAFRQARTTTSIG